MLFAAAVAFAVVEMSATFVLARRWGNYGIVDVVWSGGFAVIALIGLVLSWNVPSAAPGIPMPLPGLLVAGMVAVWSLRLAVHLGIRVASHHPVEDVRYAQLRREWGDATSWRMFGFYQLQGVLQAVLSTPFLLVFAASRNGTHRLGVPECLGLAIWVTGILGESIADRQLARFRGDPANRGRVCQAGLWNWSRHPNYFFEWLVWVGYAVFALGSPWGWAGLLAPLLMGHFLVNVTGIPMTEALSVNSKGDAYREYQRTTSAFIPWFKRAG
ncbi:MAG: DUF1295 domain-containing protein [Verrucomicrobiales bacterium]|nr:DUF1295 domain-containing protein [Verrucomicrobiales bacterium]